MLDTKLFADKLRYHRKRLGLTQEVVAERIGVSGQAVSKWGLLSGLPDLWNPQSPDRAL